MADATTVGGSDRQRITQAQRTEFRAGNIRIDAVDLVGHQEATLVPLAQVFADHLVRRGQPGAGVDHEQDGIGFLDGL